MWLFFTQICFIGLFTVPDVNQRLSLILPSGDFPDEGGVVLFRDDIHDKYLINIPKQYVTLLGMERRARWRRFHFDTVNTF